MNKGSRSRNHLACEVLLMEPNPTSDYAPQPAANFSR